jgi:peptide/nickel transport system ATP-binding protein
MALLLISHNLDVMAARVERLAVMYGGQIVESGPTREVFEQRAHPYTRGLFAARPRLGLARGTRLATIRGRVPALHEMPAGCAFADRCGLVIDACRAAPPAEHAISPSHTARCIRIAPSPSKGEGRGGGQDAAHPIPTPIPTFPLAGGRG